MADSNPTENYKEDKEDKVINIVAYMFAGLAMMLNIRLSYSAAPYALLRFKLPENLFSVFVRTTSSALELWCLPSMLLGNLMEQFYNQTQNTPSYHTPGITAKANDIQDKAQALKTKVSDTVSDAATQLANKAGLLNSAAGDLPKATGDTLAGLSAKATELATAAKGPDGGDNTSLYKKAEALKTGGVTVDKAIAVIEAFNTVKEKYETLAKDPTYTANKPTPEESTLEPGSAKAKVRAVEDAWNQVKSEFDKLCKALIKEFAGHVETNARNLAENSGSTPDEANNVINNFNVVAKAYNALGDNSQVKDDFETLQKVYSEAIYQYKWHILTIPSMFTNWLNFLTFVILFIVYISGGDQGSVTGYYWVMAISGFVFGINMVLVYAVDYRYLPYYIAGENSFPIVTSAILYVTTSIFGNRRKYNSDYLVVLIDISISIFIAFVASVLWTWAFVNYRTPKASPDAPNKEVVSPVLLVLVGMGLVYAIYPGIAPGMIVPFYLIDKIEMVLLILTTFPPLIFAFTTKFAPSWSPKTEFLLHSGIFKFGGWKDYKAPKDHGSGLFEPGADVYGWMWHFFDILAPLQILLAVIFIYSIHYRDSSISRSIVNQPKMSTFLTIIFYMCHEIMLATGFPGLVCNGGVTYVLLPTQWVGALLMVFLAFYSIGYITEYKKHDPSQWPTEGMTKWNALCYWLKMASKITNKNFKQLFTTDLRRDLLLCIQKNELI